VAPSSSGVEILKHQGFATLDTFQKLVRDRQRREGFLSGEEHTIRRLEKVNLTESQRRDAIYYNLGHVVEFHRRARGGFKSGERWEVGRCSSQSVVVVKDGQAKILPLAEEHVIERAIKMVFADRVVEERATFVQR
jgi:hypothetical protein